MRYLFVPLFLLLNIAANAMCAFSGIWCWPSAKTIKSNGILMIEFYGYSQLIVDGLHTKYPIYLEGDKEKIKLLITETLQGEFSLTQIIARPEKELHAGVTYKLVIDSLPKEHRVLSKWDREAKKVVPYSWTAVTDKDLVSPVWNALPSYVSKSYAMFGCGPAQYVNYKLGINDASEVLVKTTVTNKATGKSNCYYLLSQDGNLVLGHGMCSGAFRFQGGTEFEAVFALMDASGNTTCDNTPAYRFTRPEEKEGVQR